MLCCVMLVGLVVPPAAPPSKVGVEINQKVCTLGPPWVSEDFKTGFDWISMAD